MRYSEEQLNFIYDRTSGYCHLCRKKLSYKNYGLYRQRGAWEVEHSIARARGGTNHLNNLYAACITCNRSKSTSSTKVIRTSNGLRRAPLAIHKRREAKQWNAIGGGVIGAILGSALGPAGVFVGSAIGAKLAHDNNPDL